MQQSLTCIKSLINLTPMNVLPTSVCASDKYMFTHPLSFQIHQNILEIITFFTDSGIRNLMISPINTFR